MQVHGQLKGGSKGNTSSHEALTFLWLVALRVARHGCNRSFTSCGLVGIWILSSYLMLSHAVMEFTHDLQQDLEAEQKGFPRCFKTHYWYPRCPKGGKYIWCVCEPCAVAYSYFKMFEGWLFQPGEVPVEDFIREMWLSTGKPRNLAHCAFYFHHLASWWPHRNDDVLLVFYEDLHEL